MINETTRKIKQFIRELGSDEYFYLLLLTPLLKREKEVITALYRDGETVKELCDRLYTSDNNIQRIRKNAIKKLDKYLSKTNNILIKRLYSPYSNTTKPVHL